MCLSYLNPLWLSVCSNSFPCICNCVFHLLIFRILYIFCIQVLCQINDLQISFTSPQFVFLFSQQYLSGEKFYIFIERTIHFFLLWIMSLVSYLRTLPLTQQFSTRGKLAPREIGQLSRHNFSCHSMGMGCYWYLMGKGQRNC